MRRRFDDAGPRLDDTGARFDGAGASSSPRSSPPMLRGSESPGIVAQEPATTTSQIGEEERSGGCVWVGG
jgi:hypothetical protein